MLSGWATVLMGVFRGTCCGGKVCSIAQAEFRLGWEENVHNKKLIVNF